MDSYNSKYPLEYYENGTAYMFYLSTPPRSGESASEDEVDMYSSAFDTYGNQPTGDHEYIKRYIGVVVGTCTLNTDPAYSAIRVMFKGNLEGETTYIVKKFIVGYTGVGFDDKEWCTAGVEVPLSSSNFVLKESTTGNSDISGGIDKKPMDGEQAGGIDKKGRKEEIAGGIDKKDNKDNASGGIDKKTTNNNVSGGIDKKIK